MPEGNEKLLKNKTRPANDSLHRKGYSCVVQMDFISTVSQLSSTHKYKITVPCTTACAAVACGNLTVFQRIYKRRFHLHVCHGRFGTYRAAGLSVPCGASTPSR